MRPKLLDLFSCAGGAIGAQVIEYLSREAVA